MILNTPRTKSMQSEHQTNSRIWIIANPVHRSFIVSLLLPTHCIVQAYCWTWVWINETHTHTHTITRTHIHLVGILWTMERPVTNTHICAARSQQSNFLAPSKIRTLYPGRRKATDLHLRVQGCNRLNTAPCCTTDPRSVFFFKVIDNYRDPLVRYSAWHLKPRITASNLG